MTKNKASTDPRLTEEARRGTTPTRRVPRRVTVIPPDEFVVEQAEIVAREEQLNRMYEIFAFAADNGAPLGYPIDCRDCCGLGRYDPRPDNERDALKPPFEDGKVICDTCSGAGDIPGEFHPDYVDPA